MLAEITLQNFKSFADERIPLAPLTLLVGANASGKSNLLDALHFLQGLALDLPVVDVLRGRWEGEREIWPGIRGGIGEVARDGTDGFTLATRWRLQARDVVHTVHYRSEPEPRLVDDELLAAAARTGSAASLVYELLRAAKFYDFRPSRMRSYVPKAVRGLGTNGENLSGVLWRLCEDEDRKLDLVDWLAELCSPELSDIQFSETDLDDVLLRLVEADGTRVSARSLSDGTLRFLALVVALIEAPRGSLILLEEIENGLHPARLHVLIELLEAVTRDGERQVIATTHSPTVLAELSEETLGGVLAFGRSEETTGSIVRRLDDLPNFEEIAERRGVEHLFTTRWLERAL